jgi:SOS response regulatory protein OraA/RecX
MSDNEAYRAAVRLLAASDKTPAELCERLTGRGFSERDAQAAVARLIREGFLRELDFAKKTVDRLFASYYGAEYVTAYLRGRKFSDEALSYAEDCMKELDFDGMAKRYCAKLIEAGKTREQARAALYRRGYREE